MIANFDQVYFFGDSLSAVDNTFNYTGGLFPNHPLFAAGRFSNGDIWVDYFTDELNLTVDPFITDADPDSEFGITFDISDTNDGVNFAIGGANSGDDNVGAVPLGLEQQLEIFDLLVEDQSHEEVLSDDLFSLWIGANDYLSYIEDDPHTPDVLEADFPDTRREIRRAVLDVVDINIGGAIQDFVELGAKDIVVFNLPSLNILPLTQDLDRDDKRSLRRLTNRHNRRLLNFIDNFEESHPDVNLIHVDVNPLINGILDDPHAFGFTNVTDNYTGIDLYTGKIPDVIPPNSPEANQYLFWDSVHFTTPVHGLIADLVMDELIAEHLIIII